MSQRLTTAVEELRAEEARIQGDLDELRGQVKSGHTQLKQIRRALSALNEKPRGKSPNQKPSATRQEVMDAMVDVLETIGSLEGDELKQRVAEKLVAAGKSRIGLALRFTQALNDGRFVRREDGLISGNTEPTPV